MNYKLVTRAEARSQGLKTYFTGRACPSGHVADRYVSSKGCVECHHSGGQAWRKANPTACYRHLRTYQLKHPEKSREFTARRTARKLQAIPPWADIDAIKQFYKECPDEHHVDHIIPLRNPLVCGLHVLENLQYLTAEENLKKGNSFSVG